MNPAIAYIKREEFDKSDDFFKIISHDVNNTFATLRLANKEYYIGYSSSNVVEVDLLMLKKESYLLIGVDLKVIALCAQTGRILFSIGLMSYFKEFEDTCDLTFTIISETEDLVINKKGLSVSQIISHELEF